MPSCLLSDQFLVTVGLLKEKGLKYPDDVANNKDTNNLDTPKKDTKSFWLTVFARNTICAQDIFSGAEKNEIVYTVPCKLMVNPYIVLADGGKCNIEEEEGFASP